MIVIGNMKICIFCSANQQIDPDFFGMTEELGRWAAENGHTIVYGGVNCGLMECVAKATKEAGGHTIGIVPLIVEKSGRTRDYVDVEMYQVLYEEAVNCHADAVFCGFKREEADGRWKESNEIQ